ncbi:MAG: Plug domain-containing protein [Eudoraea sp.]
MKKSIQLIGALFILLMMVFSIGTAQKFSPNIVKLQPSELRVGSLKTFPDSLILMQERILLHIANQYVGNDNVFFKGYLLSGLKQNRYGLSGVLNVELLDRNGAVLKRQFHRIADGMVVGNLEFPKNIKPGKYYVRAYTRWMQNYGEDFYTQKRIVVGGPLSKITETGSTSDFLIVPEGGTLLNGHDNRLVIKVPHSQKTEGGIVGRILDSKNNEVAIVNDYSTCIGSAIFRPIKGELYRLELENGAVYPMPKAKDKGYLLYVNNLDPLNARIQITASSKVLGTTIKLVGTLDGIKYFEKELDFEDGKIEEVELSKVDIPNGILMLKLIDETGTELAKRPIWIDGERLLINISAIPSNTSGSTYKIKVTDKTNSPVKTQVAVSINKFESEYKNTIGDKAIGCSDLFTFPEIVIRDNNSTDRKNRFLIDLNVLLSEIELNNNSPNENYLEHDIKYPVQRGLELTGYTYNLNNEVLSNTKIQIMALSDDEMWIKETMTDTNGLFKLEEMDINGKVTLVFRTKGKDAKSRLVKVKLAKDWEKKKAKSIARSTKKQEQAHINEITSLESVDTTRLIELKEVEVSENRVKMQKYTTSIYGIDVPKKRIKYQDPKRPRSIGQMISEIPGVAVSGIGSLYPSMTIPRASGPVLFVLDGFPLAQGNDGLSLGGPVSTSLVEILNMVSVIDVERIELLIGADAAIYGTRGAGGVISIYTRSGKELESISRKEGQLVFEGYEPILEFDPYNQARSKRTKEKANLLYWNPELETDENGEALIKVPVSFIESVIKIEASVITPDGKRGSLSVNF